jgi:hypothetical protein
VRERHFRRFARVIYVSTASGDCAASRASDMIFLTKSVSNTFSVTGRPSPVYCRRRAGRGRNDACSARRRRLPVEQGPIPGDPPGSARGDGARTWLSACRIRAAGALGVSGPAVGQRQSATFSCTILQLFTINNRQRVPILCHPWTRSGLAQNRSQAYWVHSVRSRMGRMGQLQDAKNRGQRCEQT